MYLAVFGSIHDLLLQAVLREARRGLKSSFAMDQQVSA